MGRVAFLRGAGDALGLLVLLLAGRAVMDLGKALRPLGSLVVLPSFAIERQRV
ncbi:MAG: hypothetical protein JXB85_15915 [Anaerolineales bacterium]|nr:hypothetical protein [Anaerolineales bacterium]